MKQDIAAIRSFNRFYTQHIGVVTESVLGAPVGLPEARFLLELSQTDDSFAGSLAQRLGMDGGQASRVVKKLEKRGLLRREPSLEDARRRRLELTEEGRELLGDLHSRAEDQVGEMLRPLASSERRELVDALRTIRRILEPKEPGPCVLRSPGPGEWGQLIARHGALYAEALGFDSRFEGIVATTIAQFLENHDPRTERFWVAEIDGRAAGWIALYRENETTARLRLFLVEPWARGRGVGKLLAEECVRFARGCGYLKIVLWTQEAFAPARAIYRKLGFVLVESTPNHRWSRDVVDETWELDL